jgi:septal ring factor EnvC (AmiA/AmiB activator)
MFAGATLWATRVDPLHPNGQAAAETPAQPLAATDPAVSALQHQLAVQQAKVDRLATKVATVRAQAKALARRNAASAIAARTSGGSSGSSGGYSSGTRSSGSSSSTRSSGSSSSSSGSSSGGHATTPAAPPPPPPATHGSTGASGTG